MKIKKKLITMMAAVAVMLTFVVNASAETAVVGGKTVNYGCGKTKSSANANTVIMDQSKGYLSIKTSVMFKNSAGINDKKTYETQKVYNNYVNQPTVYISNVYDVYADHYVSIGASTDILKSAAH